MANRKTEQPETRPNKYRDGRWSVPSKRAKGYAADRKARVHTDRRKGNRSAILSRECGRDICSARLITQVFISTRRHWQTEKREKRHWRFPKSLGSGERTEVMRHDGR